MELVSVAAVSQKRVIGRDGELPWQSIPADKARYRRRVADAPVILGRRTFESMLDDLPGRAQIVLSRTPRTFEASSAHHASSVDEAIRVAESLGGDTSYVLGGGGIYELFQPHLDRMILSRIPGEYEGDSYYPEWDENSWTVVSQTDFEDFRLEEWRRDRPDAA